MRVADYSPEKIVRQDVDSGEWPSMLRKSMRDA